MAPRRGGGGGYSSGWGNEDLWSQTVLLSLDGYGATYKSLFIARFAFDVLSLISFVAFFIWACTLRNRTLPRKSLIFALLSFISSQVVYIVWGALYIAETEVMMYYLISLMLWELFFIVGVCLTFHVFWKLIHNLLGRLTDSGKPYAALPILHWVFFSIALILGLAEFALWVAIEVYSVNHMSFDLSLSWARLRGAMHIIYWVLSMEILAWIIFVVVKAGNHRFVSKMPAISLIVGAVCWFAVCFAWAIIYIRHGIILTIYWPSYLTTIKSVVQFVFWVGTFTGILLCCSKFSKLGDGPEKFTPVQYPAPQYPPGQFQSQYPAQYPQGQYPPTQQQPYGTAPYQAYSAQAHHQASSPRATSPL